MVSVQQELVIAVVSSADLLTWQGVGGVTHSCQTIEVTDADQILPFTTLSLSISEETTPGGPGTQPWNIEIELDTGATQNANAQMIKLAIESWVRGYGYSNVPAYEDLRSMSVEVTPSTGAGPATVTWRMPWGMLGTVSYTADGPLGAQTAAPGFDGVDNPVVYGILGPRRHVFSVRGEFEDDYYGDVPIG
jgi:hypothetical protein